ncbi:MAG: MauE/DoxX family redox-associated membrane protein [Verrucomicrobiota bacterium]
MRWLLGGLLLWAAVSKLANPTEFLGSIYAYQLPLPRMSLQMAAVVLPWAELLCGLLLLAGLWQQTALLCVTALMVLFVIATGQAWFRGLDITCGCYNFKIFGWPESLPGLVRFLESVAFAFCRNLLLTGLAGFLLRQSLRQPEAAQAITGE